MTRRRLFRAVLGTSSLAILLAGCAGPRTPKPLPASAESSANYDDADGLLAGREAQATIVAGRSPPPPIARPKEAPLARGDTSLNLPNADPRVVAKAVLGDLLHLPYTVDPGATAPVTLVTAQPVARSALLELLERALRASNLALVPQGGGGYQITTTSAPGATAPIAENASGFGTETVNLQFIAADEMRKLLDSLVPGTVTSADPGRNVIVIAGTTGQRAAVRDILKQFDVNWLRNMSFALFVPQRTDSRLIAPELDKLINDPTAPTRGLVRLIAMEKLNGILAISAQRQYLEDVRRWVEILDREGESSERRLFVYHVQNERARDLARTLNVAFGIATAGGPENPDPLAQRNVEPHTPPGPNSAYPPAPPPPSATDTAATPANRAGRSEIGANISADENTNSIIVYGTPREYAVIEAALRKLDIMPYQVMIEAAITEVTLTDNLRFGVQWNFSTGGNNFALGEGTSADPIRNFPGFSYFYSRVPDISATLNALEKSTHVNVISAPKLMVLNNQTAALQVGDQVPITTQTAVGVQNANSAVVNSVEYRDTGVILKVTPRVNAGGLVLLDIAQEVSDVSATQTSGIDSPTISTRRITTSIAVQDGQVIALGGLFRNSKSFGKNGIPGLSRIPILGSALFGNRNDVSQRTELLVILKPHVLRSIDDGRAITEELRAKLHTLEPFRTEGRIP